LEPGTIVRGRFRVEPFATHGGMGTVYRAYDLETGAFVALKTVADDPRFAERFARETRLLSELTHPATVRFVEAGHHGSKPYLAMEWVSGCDLAEEIARGAMSLEAALTLCTTIAEALGEAHSKGIVHRDIKPKNVMLAAGDVRNPRLTDFGIARVDAATRSLTQAGTAVGTPGFMAPEQVRSADRVDARADVFSLGCVLYACVTGKNPYAAESAFAALTRVVAEEPPRLSRVWKDVPPELEETCAILMSKDPSHRPAGGDAAATLLRACAYALGERLSLRFTPIASVSEVEQRFASAAFIKFDDGAERSQASSEEATVLGPSFQLTELIVQWVNGFGREPIVLGPTLVAISFSGAAPASDLATQAVACALGLAERVPAVKVVVVTARAQPGREDLRNLSDRALLPLREAAVHSGAPRVTVDETTASLVSGVFSVVPSSRGFFVVRPSETAVTLDPPSQRAFEGRQRELALLETLANECFEDPVARAVILEGPQGIGKTRLAEEWFAALKVRFPALGLIACKGVALGVGAPLSLLANLVLRTAVDAKASVEEKRAAVFEWMEAELARRPVLLFVEDLGFGDRTSVQLAEELVRRNAERPLLVVGTLRPETRGGFPQLWRDIGVLDFTVTPLSRTAVEKLVRKILGEVPSELTERIVDGAEGNPFRVEEITKAVRAGNLSFPDSVLALVEARLSTLAPEDRRLMRAASVFGEDFWSSAVASLLPELGPDEVEVRIRGLVTRDFFREEPKSLYAGERQFCFRQSLLREASYGMLCTEDRRAAHRLAADWLESTGQAAPEVLANHRALAVDSDGGGPTRVK
jgi:eukaryotic-like serine/threonine-protein kinase